MRQTDKFCSEYAPDSFPRQDQPGVLRYYALGRPTPYFGNCQKRLCIYSKFFRAGKVLDWSSQMREIALHWITQHGYAGIFSLLVFGIVGLPVPDEWLLTFSGYLVFKHTLRFLPTFGAAFLGSACGITVSYSLGRIFDTLSLYKYGWLFHLTPERLARVHSWFERRGRWTLLVGYFIPGVRHLTGYVAGVSRVELREFCALRLYRRVLLGRGLYHAGLCSRRAMGPRDRKPASNDGCCDRRDRCRGRARRMPAFIYFRAKAATDAA